MLSKIRRMHNSKLLTLLSSLSPAEWRRMRKIFQSPFFTTNKRHLVLYDLLKKYHPDFSSLKLSKEKIFPKLYPGKPFNDGLFRVLIREFTQMTEEYLLILKLREDKFQSKKMLAQVYHDHNLHSFFARETDKLLQELDKQPYRDWDYYKAVYELNFDHFFHPSTKKTPDHDLPLLMMMDSLDKQFALAKFRVGSEMLNRAKIYAKEYDIRLFEEIKALAKQNFAKDNILFQLYVFLFQLYEAKEEEKVSVFEELKKVFSQHFRALRQTDQSLFLTQLINFTIKKINSGNAAYYKKAFELYQIGLEADLVLQQGSIDESVYGNIVLLGCRAEEFTWVADFMEEYKNNLPEEVREDAYELNKGLYYFHKKDFANAQFQFMNYGYSPKFQLKARTNVLKTLFERFLHDKSLFELLIAQMNAFEKYIQRNALEDEYKKQVHLDFISILRRLINGIFENRNRKKLKQKIKNQVAEKQKMVGKTWLKNKLEELR